MLREAEAGGWPAFVVNTGDLTNIGTDEAEYRPTVTMTASVIYNITAVNGDAVNITETITGFSITYPFSFNASHMPFLASYNETVAKVKYLQDFVVDVHAMNFTSDFRVPGNYSHFQTITTTVTNVPAIENRVVYYLNNNSVVPQYGQAEIINKFLVSSNISGPIGLAGKNLAGNTSTDKAYGHGMFYTPLSFAGQHGTFWLNMNLNLTAISDMGLWTVAPPGAPDATTFPMTFRESETYTWHDGQDDSAFRWRAKFEVGYPKVGGKEQARYDSETGILVEYYTEQTNIGWQEDAQTFYKDLHPQALKCELLSVTGIVFGANATPEIPGFPVIAVLVAICIGVALVHRKSRK
ncbi:MAG: hypothetical protein GYA24_15180 [Candidatus Lokiarchaeota archaeon]|nr:hypothetical protein [Candidatus Lokiarchaeota archaeon]